jgi:hypothetical protein
MIGVDLREPSNDLMEKFDIIRHRVVLILGDYHLMEKFDRIGVFLEL